MEYFVSDFLNSYEFHPNSVDFRIVSSKSMEKFKNVQAFQLNEIRNGRYQFGASKREIMLLKFDLCTRVLNEIENQCIRTFHYHKNTTPEFIKCITNIMEISNSKFISIITTPSASSAYFDQKFTKIWAQYHKKVQESLVSFSESLIDIPLMIYFTKIVDMYCNKLQSIIVELYELDIHMTKLGHTIVFDYAEVNDLHELRKIHNDKIKFSGYTGEPDSSENIVKTKELKKTFMIVINDSMNSSDKQSLDLMKERVNVYLNNFEIDKFYFKNLSDKPISKEILELIEGYGKDVDYRSSVLC